MKSEPLKPQKVLDGIFAGYKKDIGIIVPKVEYMPTEAYEDLQKDMRLEILKKFNNILKDYNIEPSRKLND